MRRPAFLLELHAPLGQRQRFLVAVLHRRHVRLVSEDGCQDVSRLRGNGQPLRMAHRDERFFEPPFLGERHAGQRVHHRQVPPIARGVQRRCGRCQVLADDRRVANLPVAQCQLVVGEADGAGIVRPLRKAQGLGEKRDAAGGLAAGGGHAAVHAPEVGQPGRIGPLPRIGRSPKCFSRLSKVVLEQPGFRQGRSNADLVLPEQPWLTKGADEQRRRFGAVPVGQGFDGTVV